MEFLLFVMSMALCIFAIVALLFTIFGAIVVMGDEIRKNDRAKRRAEMDEMHEKGKS